MLQIWEIVGLANTYAGNTFIHKHKCPQPPTWDIRQANVVHRRNGSVPPFIRAGSSLSTSQWEILLQSNAVSHWLGTNLKSVLVYCIFTSLTRLNYTSSLVFGTKVVRIHTNAFVFQITLYGNICRIRCRIEPSIPLIINSLVHDTLPNNS